jgi:hypothetical protein
MKKLIQFFSILSLVVVFSIISAQAQTSKQYAAEIPFNFSVGQKSYQAGSYVIKVSKLRATNSISLSLEDKEKNLLQTILVRENGDVAKAEPKLIFTSHDNQRFLTKMVMQGMGVSIVVSDNDKQNLKAKGKPEVAARGAAVASN